MNLTEISPISVPVLISVFIAIKINTQIGEIVRFGEIHFFFLTAATLILYDVLYSGENVRLFPLFLFRRKNKV